MAVSRPVSLTLWLLSAVGAVAAGIAVAMTFAPRGVYLQTPAGAAAPAPMPAPPSLAAPGCCPPSAPHGSKIIAA